VESWAEKRLAAFVAKGVKGVKAVENNINIEYEMDRLDSEIKADVERQLMINPLIDEHLIDVEVKNREVFLIGTVGSAMEKTRAYSAAWVAGTADVDDGGLEVEYWAKDEKQRATPVVKSDEEIEKAVKDALLFDPRTLSFEIGVDAENGQVTLDGEVDNLIAKQAAAQDAQNTMGVWDVENEIIVRPQYSPTDEELERDIKDALLWNPIVERFEISVFVRNKKVYLYGRVDSEFEKLEAENVASRINGVVAVENNIETAEAWSWKSDKEIEEDIEEQFNWSVFVGEEDIDVSVQNGVATLEGEVDSMMELDQAIKDAFDGGARRVINRLDIDDQPDYYKDLYFRDYRWPYWTIWPSMPPLWS
jgi:osmotically-inducible protein OsmY